MSVTADSELLQACRVVYAEEADAVDLSFLRTIQPQCLKTAYRRRALAVHPDLHANRGPAEYERHNRLFQDLTAAYESLCRYLELRPQQPQPRPAPTYRPSPPRPRPAPTYRPSPPRPRPAPTYRPSPPRHPRPNPRTATGSPGDGLRRRQVPNWRLRIGESLFHTGHITWSALISALVRQKGDRPPLGKIAQRWGWITEEKILALLRDRRSGERIGDIFLRRRVMTSFRLGMLLSFQRRNSRPLGAYFVEAGLIDATQLAHCLLAQQNHNQRCGTRARASAIA